MVESNPPINRMRHVIKTYRDSKAPWIPVQVARATYYLMGLDHDVPDFNEFVDPFEDYLRSQGEPGEGPLQWHERGLKTFVTSKEWAEQERGLARLRLAGDPLLLMEAKWSAEEEYDQMPHQEHIDRAWGIFDAYLEQDLPSRHEHDFIIPWMARELGRLAKAARKNEEVWVDYRDAEAALLGKGPAIAMWAAHENVDLNKTSLAEALEAVAHFDAFKGEMPQGRVVYQFDDGWTVQELSNDPLLDAEGQAMQHCVGDYCFADMPPEMRIYSIRDERGMPHVTMEYNGHTGHFVQIQGKQNEPPVERYMPYVLEVIDNKFDGDPIGKLLAGIDGLDVDFTDKSFCDVEFSEVLESISGANFSGSRFVSCIFDESHIKRSHFDECEFEDCNWSGGELSGTTFIGAQFKSCRFEYVDMDRCDFSDASFESIIDSMPTEFVGTSLVDAKFDRASFVNAFFERASVSGASFRGSDINEGVVDDPYTFESEADVIGTPLGEWIEHAEDLRTDESRR